MRHLLAAGVLACMAALLPAACSSPSVSTPQPGPPVRVAAAADLKFALDEIVDRLEEEDPDLDVTVTYGSSGTFVQQISNGAPFDLYLSADVAYVQDLVDAGLADEAERFTYAYGRLVLWLPDSAEGDPADGLHVLTRPEVRRVAIANPEHAPYGRAAVAAMRSAGVEDSLSGKLVLGENVAQAAEFVQSGNADAGIVAMSLVLADPVRDVGTWAEVPPDLFPPLEQGGAVLAGARQPDAARAVRDALLGPDGRAVLESYGFGLPER